MVTYLVELIFSLYKLRGCWTLIYPDYGCEADPSFERLDSFVSWHNLEELVFLQYS